MQRNSVNIEENSEQEPALPILNFSELKVLF